MKTTKQTTKKQLGGGRFRPSRKTLFGIATVVALGLIGGQLYFDYELTRGPMARDNSTIANLIVSAGENLLKPAVIEPTSKRLYIPEANLVLPFYPASVSGVQYSYSPAFENSDAEVSITSRNAVLYGTSKVRAKGALPATEQNSRDLFAEVPGMQACIRGIAVTLSEAGKAPRDADMAKDGQKRLADGRTASFHVNEGCGNQPKDMLTYVKQLESY